MARIEAAQSASEVSVRLAEQSAREQYQAARTAAEQNVSALRDAAAKETAALLAAEQERYEAQKKAQTAELALAQQQPEKEAAQIIRLNQEIENAETEHQARMSEIRREGARQSQEDQRRIAQETMRHMAEEVSFVQETSNRERQYQLRMDDERLKQGAITRGTWLRDENSAVEQWDARQREVLEHELATARAVYGQQSTEYKRFEDKLTELGQQRIQKERELENQALAGWRNWSNLVTHALSSGVNQWIEGQKTFGQAMRQTWNSIVMETIEDIEKIGEKWIVEHVLMAAVEKLLGTGSGQAQQVAKTAAANTAMATSDAGLATAGTLAYYSSFAPEIAPAMAAAQLAIGESYTAIAAFEQGGLVPATGLAMLHTNEMVLPAGLSQHVLNTAGGGGGNPRGRGESHVHVHYSPTIQGGGSTTDMKQLLSQHADCIGRIVQRQYKAFNR